MTPRRGTIGLPAHLLLLAALSGPRLGGAEPPSREQELAGIRAEISRLEERLERVRERAGGLAGQLETLEVELALQEQRLAEARSAGELAAGRVAESEEEVVRLGAAVATARQALTRRLGGLYRLGSQGYLRMLLSLEAEGRGGGDGGQVLQGIRILRYLARRDARAVERYTAARRRLEEEQDELLARRRDVELWVEEEAARRQRLAAARRRQAALLERVEAEERRLAERSEELADKARRLEELLDLLAADGVAGGPAGTPVQRFRGVLDRPVAGEVSVPFGPRLDPRYRTRVPHNGLTFATAPGSEVRAVYAGEVLYAAPFQGFGPTVVVHHPGRVFTLYAGLASLVVERGETVDLGATVGTADSDLYFEVRVEKRPEDPQQWLR